MIKANIPVNNKVQVLLILPPFYSINSPPVELGIMKAILKNKGIYAEVLYANLYFKRQIPPELNNKLGSFYSMPRLIEFVFASEAFPEYYKKHEEFIKIIMEKKDPDGIQIVKLRNKTKEYLLSIEKIIKKKKPRIVWIYSYLRQLTASIAIANHIKQQNSSIITGMGGGNCQLPMGKAILDIAPSIDYIFSGEAEFAFLDFCKNIFKGDYPSNRILQCGVVQDINLLPNPDYSDYFEQLFHNFIRNDGISFETSRGCWWGNTNRCLFCGFHIPYREKNTKKIKKNLLQLLHDYPSSKVNFKDLIMPKEIAFSVIKDLNSSKRLTLFYQIKPTTPLKELMILKKKGLNTCQSGIESLQDKLLITLKKGTTVLDNIRFLRDCTRLNIKVLWNFLYDIPFEKEEEYKQMLSTIPQLYHLPPPKELRPIIIQRFSPLYMNAEKYGIKNIRPLNSLNYIFPDNTDINNLSIFFEGDYKRAFDNIQLKNNFFNLIKDWQNRYLNNPPLLLLKQISNIQYELIDTRNEKAQIKRLVNTKHYRIINKLEKATEKVEIRDFVNKLDANTELLQLTQWDCIYESIHKCISLVIQSDFDG